MQLDLPLFKRDSIRVWGLGFRAQGFGFRVSGLVFRAQGLYRIVPGYHPKNASQMENAMETGGYILYMSHITYL